MFNLTLVARETGGTLNFENCSFVCKHRNKIDALSQSYGTSMVHNNTIFFETEEQMRNFASEITTFK